ncbi:MAG: hypothetical protein AB7H93_23465 [Vicinamibacterales bacterium]
MNARRFWALVDAGCVLAVVGACLLALGAVAGLGLVAQGLARLDAAYPPAIAAAPTAAPTADATREDTADAR